MNPKMSVIIVAGGQGARMQNTTPKQFIKICQKTILQYSLDVFLKLPETAEIVVVCDPIYRDLIELQNSTIPFSFASPGNRRQDSVYNGLQQLKIESPLICIHDAARPLIDSALVRRVIEGAILHGAATAGMPFKFTVKEHDGHFFVKNTPDRSKYWEIQTPQIMHAKLLKEGFEYVQKNHLEVTDDVSILEHLGHKVKLVEGSYKNIKVTTPEDLSLVELYNA